MNRPWDKFLSDSDREIYEASGYGRPAGMGDRPAVLVIDVNYAFLGHERLPIAESMRTWRNSCGPAGWDSLPAIGSVLDGARDRRIPVFFTTGVPTRPDRFGRGAWDFKNQRAVQEQLPPELARIANSLPPEIAPLGHEMVLPKSKPSAFFATPLLSHLVDLRIDTLIVCGTTTSGCVRGTVLDAFNLNYRVAVVEEGTFDRFESSHALSLFDMNAKYADVLPTVEVLAYLDTVERGLYDEWIRPFD